MYLQLEKYIENWPSGIFVFDFIKFEVEDREVSNFLYSG